MARYLVFLLLGLLAACAPDAKGLKEGEKAVVVEVYDSDTLVLDTGLKVHLTGVEGPHKEWPLAKEARLELERVAKGRKARLFYGGKDRLDDGAALAHVFVQTEGGRWIALQKHMLRKGLVRAHSWKDNHARAAEFLKMEAQARSARKGLWSEAFYSIRRPETLVADIDTYQIVEGTILSIEPRDDRVYLNFGPDYRTDFTITLSQDALTAFPAPEALKGRKVRVRGYVSDRGGPLIRVDHAEQMEML